MTEEEQARLQRIETALIALLTLLEIKTDLEEDYQTSRELAKIREGTYS